MNFDDSFDLQGRNTREYEHDVKARTPELRVQDRFAWLSPAFFLFEFLRQSDAF